MTDNQVELCVRRALSNLRHLYQQMVAGYVHGQDGIEQIAHGILSPSIVKLEELADHLCRGTVPPEFTTE